MSYGWRIVDGTSIELCDECGFDARDLGVDDIGGAFVAAWSQLGILVDRVDAGLRPDPLTWSAREYVDHCVDMTRENLEWAAESGVEPPGPDVRDIGSAAAACSAMVATLRDSDWPRVVEAKDRFCYDVTVQWVLTHTVHDLQHHVLDIRRGYAAISLAAAAGFTIRPSRQAEGADFGDRAVGASGDRARVVEPRG